ncbi:hypothetical protein MTO96_035282 [Rhipicephalus appendiculatus]
MESRRTFALKETAVVVTVACILIACLSAVAAQGEDRCEPDSVKKCYLHYVEAIRLQQFKTSPDGAYDEEELKRVCSLIKGKIQCHIDLAGCPETANGDYRIQERGYEAMTNIVCNRKMLEDFDTAYQCQDDKKMDECAKGMFPASDRENPRVIADYEDYCRVRSIEMACYAQTFNSSCPLPMKTAQTALNRVADAIAQLAGCPSSAHAVMASKGFLILLVAPVILSWFRA